MTGAGVSPPTVTRPRSRDPFGLIVSLLLLAACVVILLLVRQNRALKADLARLATPPAEGPETGTPAASISGVDASGRTVLVEFGVDPRSTVLCVFSTLCPACASTLPIWKETVEKADPAKVRILGVTYEDAAKGEAHLRREGLGLPVLQVDQAFLAREYRMGVVPLTILIAPSGRVERTYPGILEGDGLVDLKRRLGLEP